MATILKEGGIKMKYKYTEPILTKEELGVFLKALFEEYASKHDAYLAISWAYSKIGKKSKYARTYFPQIIVVGQEDLPEDADYVQEIFLGRLVMIQPGAVVFSTGEGLTFNGPREYLCGTIGSSEELGNCLAYFFLNGDHSAAIFNENGDKFFYWQLGNGYDAMGSRYHIEDEMYEKIRKFLATSI
jgi:hypothetical protein